MLKLEYKRRDMFKYIRHKYLLSYIKRGKIKNLNKQFHEFKDVSV